jgi:hypothetical protein
MTVTKNSRYFVKSVMCVLHNLCSLSTATASFKGIGLLPGDWAPAVMSSLVLAGIGGVHN